ncbi:MAG: hypothetical protein H7263_14180, partial [Candidatus Sericytochromatia bacterium]|nr:hypothetical protein [Candidatus Sericytochromatia bacterium]
MFEPDFENPLFKLSYFRHKLNKILSNDIIEQEKYNKIIEHLEQEEKSIWNNYSNLYLTNQAESEECLEQQLFYLKNKNIIDEETFNKFAQSWQIKKFITITDPNKQTQKNTSEKLESSNEFSISFEKEKIKENDKRNMIEVLVEKISGKWFVFLGVMLMVLSSFPIIREINSNSLIYLVLLLYSIGLFGSGYLTRKYFPWTGNVFYLVSILITPVILASVTSLDFYNKVDLLIACFTFVSIPLINYLVLKTLYNKLRFSYFIIFVLLGLSAALPAKIQDLFSQLNLLNSDFETLTLLLLFSLLFLGSKILNNDLKIDKTSNNVKPILILHSLLIYIYFILISSNNFSLQSYGLIVILIASLLWNIAQKIKCLIKVDNIEVNILPMLKNIIISGYILSFISPIISFSDISKFIITCFIGLIMYVFNQDLFKQSSTKDELSVFGNHQNKYLKFFNNIMGGLFFNSFMYFILILWNLTNDIQSMIISITMLIIVLLANIKKFEKWKESFYFISILTSIDIWAKISLFDSWSSYTFISMFILSSIYLLNSIYYKRNVLSYVSIVTFSIAYFSLISVINPTMSFYNYRYYAVLLSFLYLSSGYFIQLRFSNSNKIDLNKKEVIKSSMTLKTLFNDDTVNPYRFQDRFSSIFPYLISEPLYNLALLMTSFSVLVNLKDYTLSIPATIFYILVFKIYPSRLWIYFALTSVTSGFIGFITGVIPDKYQNWGFIFISFNWFFVGTIVEEFFEAYERKNNNLFHQEKKYAQPFFQVALIINILLLRYFFVDLQNITSPEGLKKVQEELLPIVFTS